MLFAQKNQFSLTAKSCWSLFSCNKCEYRIRCGLHNRLEQIIFSVGLTLAFYCSTFSYTSEILTENPLTKSSSEAARNVPFRKRAFDFDGDRKVDFSVYRPSNGTWYIWNSGSNTVSTVQFGIATDKPVPADYDGDRKADIAVWRPSEGTWYVIRSSTGSIYTVNWGLSEDIPNPNDYDGDGKDDITIYRPSEGHWYVLKSSNSDLLEIAFGGADGDRPLAADYDGDQKADVSIWNPNTLNWGYLSSIDSSVNTYNTHFLFRYIIPIDTDGDRKIDRTYKALLTDQPFAPIWGVWSGGFFRWAYLGADGDIPTAADFDGDGIEELAVFRPSDGSWWSLQTIYPGSLSIVHFGTAGDIPIPSVYFR